MATTQRPRKPQTAEPNRDPISGAPGAHPVGTGVGAALGGAAAGAAAGAVAGPVGAAVGAIAGGVGGGLAGKAIAEQLDPTAEESYWRENYQRRPYYQQGTPYDDYGPAYRSGWEARTRYPDRKWDDLESDLESKWEKSKGKSRLTWERAKGAARDAWDRVETALPGDADGDGK